MGRAGAYKNPEPGDVYALAMHAIGPRPLQTAPEEYGEHGTQIEDRPAGVLQDLCFLFEKLQVAECKLFMKCSGM